mmetsp:Transcript_3913/g.5690  ORF Transcript_3913/g.5690 Transcript_3913/m.5690 type:complete len:276 (-) Transcript_3913:856-1683(-)
MTGEQCAQSDLMYNNIRTGKPVVVSDPRREQVRAEVSRFCTRLVEYMHVEKTAAARLLIVCRETDKRIWKQVARDALAGCGQVSVQLLSRRCIYSKLNACSKGHSVFVASFTVVEFCFETLNSVPWSCIVFDEFQKMDEKTKRVIFKRRASKLGDLYCKKIVALTSFRITDEAKNMLEAYFEKEGKLINTSPFLPLGFELVQVHDKSRVMSQVLGLLKDNPRPKRLTSTSPKMGTPKRYKATIDGSLCLGFEIEEIPPTRIVEQVSLLLDHKPLK